MFQRQVLRHLGERRRAEGRRFAACEVAEEDPEGTQALTTGAQGAHQSFERNPMRERVTELRTVGARKFKQRRIARQVRAQRNR